MTTRDRAPVGAPCWLELGTPDGDKARAFYRDLFGWTSEVNEDFGGYINFERDAKRVAGGMVSDGSHGPTNVWSVYLAVDDAASRCAAAKDAGATVIVDPMPVGDLGNMAFVIDPTGAAIGMWQPGTHTGFSVIDEPGAPSWFELHTTDYDGALAFYRAVFGWDLRTESDSPEFRYSTLHDGNEQLAGIMDATAHLPAGAPPFWTVYFRVADADAAAARVTELGGSVVNPPEDTPYGRIGTVTDSTGTPFRLRA